MRYLYILLLTGIAIACKPKKVEPTYNLGSIDISSFIAIGGDRVAGFQDDALSYNGQMNSLGSIINNQFNQVGFSNYNQPLINDQNLGINLNGDAQLIMGYKTDCNNETSLSPVRYASQGLTSALSEDLYTSNGPFHNLGVPGMSITDLYVAGFANPFYQRFKSSGSASVASDVIQNTPTFLLSDFGQDDLMQYALSGGNTNPIIDEVTFELSYAQLLDEFQNTATKGILCNIPDITQFPYFTTIPFNGLELDATNANTMNQVFNPLGMSFVEGTNPFTVEDSNEPFGVRKLVEGELILLSVPLDSVKCNGMGSIIPIPEEYVLSLDEINEINQKRIAYNEKIQTLATAYSFAVADFESVYNSVNLGLVHNGVSFSNQFVSGGFFSLDGRNPTSKGMALLANECIKAMNKKYESNIPQTEVNGFDGIYFP